MKWTNEELQDIAENRYGLAKESHQESFILGVDFALQQLGFEDYEGRLVNDGGKHYSVVVTGSVFGQNKTFYATEAEANQAVGAQKMSAGLMEYLDFLEAFGTPEVELVVGEGSLTGESFCVLSDGSVVSTKEAAELLSTEISALFNK